MSEAAVLPEIACSDEKVTLLLADRSSRLGKTGERLVVEVAGSVTHDIAAYRVEQVVVQTRAASVTAEALRLCAKQGIAVTFLEGTGKPYAMMSSPLLVGTASTRRGQLRAFDTASGGALVLSFVNGKLANQARLLRYVGKYRRSAASPLHAELEAAACQIEALRAQVLALPPASCDDLRAGVIALEGNAARAYWSALRTLVPGEMQFTSREHRGATDPFNCALNYGYGILENQVWRGIVCAGLDPFAGFLHVDRPGRPSLVLDLMEEFRPCAVDRAVLSLATTRQPLHIENGFLDAASRRVVAEQVLARFAGRERVGRSHQFLGAIVTSQAQALATHVRDERPYRPFLVRW